MLVVETIAKIRRAYFIQGKSIKQICRDLYVSRNTVRKVVRSGVTEFSYDRSSQPRPKIDPWRSELDEMLAENARQSKRQRLTLVRIYEELRNRGYDGSYDAVRRYAASWSKATREASAAAYVPLIFPTISMRLCCINHVKDSLCESSMIAGVHEQLGPYEVQDHELVGLQ